MRGDRVVLALLAMQVIEVGTEVSFACSTNE